MNNRELSNTVGLWLGSIGLVLVAIGLFWHPVAMNRAAIFLGIIGLFTPEKGLNSITIIMALL